MSAGMSAGTVLTFRVIVNHFELCLETSLPFEHCGVTKGRELRGPSRELRGYGADHESLVVTVERYKKS